MGISSVHWRVFSAVGDTTSTMEGYHSVLNRIFSSVVHITNTVEDCQYCGEISRTPFPVLQRRFLWKINCKLLYETIFFIDEDETNYLYPWIVGSAVLLFIIGLGGWLLIKRLKLQQDENSSSSSEKNCHSHLYNVNVKEEYGPDVKEEYGPALHSAPVGKFSIQLSYHTLKMDTKSHPLEPGHLFRFLCYSYI